ncbi:MAG: hypothetical protein OMM_10697 [Candidatus Magnetoglobus multicellularis str. Araruama]|uniref:Thioesterase domain-containing protein n=1 Tax=Candidatus Magnetoglobus multicellularis str. Araruama TaxID=890399 RepID=A0A1V1P091_9BACT|nr:MAG: hypothetical protein OMM_10697 [Candidatus Magnetoglobus multicellularis str. Araruama]
MRKGGEALLLKPSSTKDYSHKGLVSIQANGKHKPIFCVHPVEGYVYCYNELSRYLGNAYPLYAFQADGITPGTVPSKNIFAMAKNYIQLMKEIQPNDLYTIVGWSFGGGRCL